MALFPTSRPAIQARVLPRFPARVTSTGGFSAVVDAGTLTLGLDYPSLADSLGIADASRFTVAAYNLDTEAYEEVRLDQFPPNTAEFRTAHGDSNYAILNTDRYVGLTATLTAGRTWSLPAANTVPAGRVVTVQDEVGGIGSFSLTVTPTGADTINGAASVVLSSARAGLSFVSDGTSKWVYSISAQVADDSVNNTKLANVATATFKGRTTAGTGDPEDMTAVQAAALLSGLVTAANDSITNAKLANVATQTFKGRVSASTGDPEDLTPAQLRDTFLPNGCVVDTVIGTYATNADLSTTIPADDTIPQNTEGTQIISVSITPKTTTNKLRVRFAASGASVGSAQAMIAALFKDSVANALVAGLTWPTSAAFQERLGFEYEFVPGATSALTLAVRVGAGSGTMRLNGTGAGRYLGGAQQAVLTVDEIKA